MDPDQSSRNTGERFPPTRATLLQRFHSPDPETRNRALDTLVQVYWRPVYSYIRIRWNRPRPEAEDLTLEFFLRAIEKGYFDKYDPSIARFRTFLRTCLDGFVANSDRAARRLKRGGDFDRVSLDFDLAESELAGATVQGEEEMDRFFHQEWARSVLTLSLAALKHHCYTGAKPLAYEVFHLYEVGAAEGYRMTYQMLADELGIPATQVTNFLAYARKEFRRIVLEMLRELTASDAEFQAEAAALLGVRES